MTDLDMKPCPFPICGSEDVGIFATSSLKRDGTLAWQGKCKKCHSCGPAHDVYEDAVVAWNHRGNT